MIVLGMSRRASFVSSAPSRRTPPGCGTARCRKVSSCSSLSPSRFSSPRAPPARAWASRRRRSPGPSRRSQGQSRRRPLPRSAQGSGRSRRSRRTRYRCARRARPEPPPPDRLEDRVDMVGHGDRGSVGIGRLETGERQRGDVVAVVTQHVGDLVPRPGAEPEPGNENDRCGRHAAILERDRLRQEVCAEAERDQLGPAIALGRRKRQRPDHVPGRR